MRKIRAVLIVGSAIFLTACGIRDLAGIESSSPQPVDIEPVVLQELPITVMHKADYNIDDSQTSKAFKVLGSDIEYRTELGRYSVEVPKPIDFQTAQVIVSTMGSQVSGGYVVSALRADEFDEKVVVTVELRAPGESCVTTQAISNPYEFSLVPSSKPIEFIETHAVTEC